MTIVVKKQLHQCPFCREEVRRDTDQIVCYDCLTRHHAECWREHGKCAVFACEGNSGMTRQQARTKRVKRYPKGVRTSTRRCPGCAAPLKVRVSRQTTYYHCTPCGGNWFDYAELLNVVGNELLSQRQPVSRDEPFAARICPVCNRGLQLSRVSGDQGEVEFDICGTCSGIYLDAGEQEQMTPDNRCERCGESVPQNLAARQSELGQLCRPCVWEETSEKQAARGTDLSVVMRVLSGKF